MIIARGYINFGIYSCFYNLYYWLANANKAFYKCARELQQVEGK